MMPEVVMFALAGRWFGNLAREGHMAFSICTMSMSFSSL